MKQKKPPTKKASTTHTPRWDRFVFFSSAPPIGRLCSTSFVSFTSLWLDAPRVRADYRVCKKE
jgi:hypothetical protein